MSWVWLIHHWNEHWTITISGWADKKPISTDDTDRQRGENFGEKTNRANAVLGQVHACEAAAAAILLPSRLLNVVWTWSRTGKLLVSRFQARCAIFYLITFPLFPAGHHLPCLAAKSSTSDTLLTLLWSSIYKEKYVVSLKYHFKVSEDLLYYLWLACPHARIFFFFYSFSFYPSTMWLHLV